jgi:hypothetical protein
VIRPGFFGKESPELPSPVQGEGDAGKKQNIFPESGSAFVDGFEKNS